MTNGIGWARMASSSFKQTFAQEAQNFVMWRTQKTSLKNKSSFSN
jgi:hypothetical protein